MVKQWLLKWLYHGKCWLKKCWLNDGKQKCVFFLDGVKKWHTDELMVEDDLMMVKLW